MKLNLFVVKKCRSCKKIKLLSEFHKQKDTKDKHRSICKACTNKAGKQYRLEHKEKETTRHNQYYQDNKENINQRRKQYNKEHKTEKAIYDKEYNQTPQGKLSNARRRAKHQQELGFNLLNEKFEGSVWHHINDLDVVAIPKEIHLKFGGGYGREKHRALILDYYGSIEQMIEGLSIVKVAGVSKPSLLINAKSV